MYWAVPCALIVIGTIGYRMIDRSSWFDGFYSAVITLTSIGHGDEHVVSVASRVLTVVLALGGIWTIATAATQVLGLLLTGELRDFMGTRRMEKHLSTLEQHVIVCGYGGIGQHVCADLVAAGLEVVAIDRTATAFEATAQEGVHPVVGDATTDSVLLETRVDHARALVAVTESDPENLLITLTARQLCPAMPIVSTAGDEGTMPKLRRAGATRVTSPDAIAGDSIASAVLRPAVLDADVEMDEQLVRAGSALDGTTVKTSGLRERRGHILVAIKRHDGSLAFDPEDDAPIEAGDTLIMLSRREHDGGRDAFGLS